MVTEVRPAPPLAVLFRLCSDLVSWSSFDTASLDVDSISICRESTSMGICITSLAPVLSRSDHLHHVCFGPSRFGFLFLWRLFLFFLFKQWVWLLEIRNRFCPALYKIPKNGRGPAQSVVEISTLQPERLVHSLDTVPLRPPERLHHPDIAVPILVPRHAN